MTMAAPETPEQSQPTPREGKMLGKNASRDRGWSQIKIESRQDISGAWSSFGGGELDGVLLVGGQTAHVCSTRVCFFSGVREVEVIGVDERGV
jgi:hypothetical protein